MKGSRLWTMKSSVSVEILPKDAWEEVAYLIIKGMAAQAAGLQRQMDGRPGAEKLNQAVVALEAVAEEIVNIGEEDGGGRDGGLL